ICRIAQCPALGRLSAFSLYWNHIGLKRAVELFASPFLDRLNEFDLSDNEIRFRGLRALLEANLPRLKSLNLRSNQLGDADLEALAASPLLGQLHTLGFSYNTVGEAGLAALVASPHAAGLKRLHLPVRTKAGMQALLDRFGEGVCVF